MEISIQELKDLFSASTEANSVHLLTLEDHPLKGKFVLVRCEAAGVHCGFLESVVGDTVELIDSYRLWRWHAKQGIALSGLAQSGMDLTKDNKIDARNSRIFLRGWCEIIPASVLYESSKEWS